MPDPFLDSARQSELTSIFAAALSLDELLEPFRNGIVVDQRAVLEIRQFLERSLNGIERFRTEIPAAVLAELKVLARIVRDTRTRCVTIPDIVRLLADADLKSAAWRGWQALVAAKAENKGLYEWADDPDCHRAPIWRAILLQACISGVASNPSAVPQLDPIARLRWCCKEITARLSQSNSTQIWDILSLFHAAADCHQALNPQPKLPPVKLVYYYHKPKPFVHQNVAHWVTVSRDNQLESDSDFRFAVGLRFNDPISGLDQVIVAGLYEDDRGQWDPFADSRRWDQVRAVGTMRMNAWLRYLDALPAATQPAGAVGLSVVNNGIRDVAPSRTKGRTTTTQTSVNRRGRPAGDFTQQRADFAKPLAEVQAMTWPEIGDRYRAKYKRDKTATNDSIRLAYQRKHGVRTDDKKRRKSNQ